MPYETWPQLVDGQLFFSGEALRDYEFDQMIAGIGEPSIAPTPSPADDHSIMTAEEACRYLRLDLERSMPLALKALNRLVDEKKVLTPTMYRKRRMYTRAECDRMAEKMQRNRD